MAARTATRGTEKKSKTGASKPVPTPVVEEEPDLLAGMSDDTGTSAPDDPLDLLSDLQEDNGDAWMPWDEEDQPDGIQGTVTYVGSVPSEFHDGERVLVEVQDRDDPEQIWSVRGYATVLQNQLVKAAPAVGDRIGIKYFGEKESKGGRDYKNFKVVIAKKA